MYVLDPLYCITWIAFFFCNLYLQLQREHLENEIGTKVKVYLTLCQMFILLHPVFFFHPLQYDSKTKDLKDLGILPLTTILYKGMFNCSEFILGPITAMIKKKENGSDLKANEKIVMKEL